MALHLPRIDLAQPVEVLPLLLLGGYEAATDAAALSRYQVSATLNVSELPTPDRPRSVQRLQVPFSDDGESELMKLLPRCCAFLDDARARSQTVLVHCALGVNRSPTVVLGYLMERCGWTLLRSYRHLHGQRRWIWPHERYLEQLSRLEQQLHGSISIEVAAILRQFPARSGP